VSVEKDTRVDDDGLTTDCLELAGLESNEAYYRRLAILVKSCSLESVVTRLESLADETLVEYVSSRYVLTPTGRSRLPRWTRS
jgi:hypothetical protein